MTLLWRWGWIFACALALVGCAGGGPDPVGEARPEATVVVSTDESPADVEQAPSSDGPDARISVAFGAESVARNETVPLEVRIENALALSGVDVRLAYDGTRLAVADADPALEGTQVGDGDLLSADFLVENRADETAHTIAYVVAQMPPSEPADGAGALVRVTFEAVAPGPAEVRLVALILADASGAQLAHETVVATAVVMVEE